MLDYFARYKTNIVGIHLKNGWADLVWASANAASLLYVTAQLRKTGVPTPVVIKDIRENAMQAILTTESKG